MFLNLNTYEAESNGDGISPISVRSGQGTTLAAVESRGIKAMDKKSTVNRALSRASHRSGNSPRSARSTGAMAKMAMASPSSAATGMTRL